MIAWLLLLSTLISSSAALWPRPHSLKNGTTILTLSPDFNVTFSHGIHTSGKIPNDVKEAAYRTVSHVLEDHFTELVPANMITEFGNATGNPLSALMLVLTGESKGIADETLNLPVENRTESYNLTIPEDGSEASLTSSSSLGLLRGLTTFEQLWFTSNDTVYTAMAPIHIEDQPAYPYRGFMLDTARNYFPVDDITHTLTTMSFVKMNMFHWHIMDSQSIPLVVPGFEDLSAKAAYSNNSIYSAEDVKWIVDFALARGIDVVVEIDLPGHTAAISAAHPEHVACAYASPWSDYAAEPPAGQLRFASPDTVVYIKDLITAAMDMFSSQYFSIGGDEVNKHCYEDDEETIAALNATSTAEDFDAKYKTGLDKFFNDMRQTVWGAGKVPVVWEESVLEEKRTADDKPIVLVWKTPQSASEATDRGMKVIRADSDYFYLDCGAGEWIGDTGDAKSWCDPFKSWQRAYSFDPIANLSDTQAELVLGGQHLLWTEQSSPTNLDSIVWPRAGASAELFWTGANYVDQGESVNADLKEAMPRMHELAFRLRNRKVGAIALQPLWCVQNPGQC